MKRLTVLVMAALLISVIAYAKDYEVSQESRRLQRGRENR